MVVHTSIYGRNRHAVALKFNMRGCGYRELKALKHIKNQKEKGNLKGSEYVMDLFDHFEYTSENGKHLVLVLEVMWGNLHTFMGGYSKDAEMRLVIAKTIVPQLLQGLQAIQACGIIHNGNNTF
jgi:serine/threonine protein kinase